MGGASADEYLNIIGSGRCGSRRERCSGENSTMAGTPAGRSKFAAAHRRFGLIVRWKIWRLKRWLRKMWKSGLGLTINQPNNKLVLLWAQKHNPTSGVAVVPDRDQA